MSDKSYPLACGRIARERATAEARFYAGRIRQWYWRGVRPGPGWLAPREIFAGERKPLRLRGFPLGTLNPGVLFAH